MQSYNSKFKIFVVSITLGSWLLALGPTSVLADEPGDSDFVYLFHLYYNNDQLFADRDFEFRYDVIPETFVAEQFSAQFPFSGEIVNLKGETAATFKFDPRRGNPNFLKGKISIKAPYVPDGQKVVFYDAQNKPLLTVFVSESSFCNDDGVCNFEKGEDEKTCSNDCRGVVPTAPPVFEEPANGASGMLKAAIYVLIIAGAGLGGWYGWKWWKSRRKPPMSQLPQNLPTNFPSQQPLSR